jgi:hypothetical protein
MARGWESKSVEAQIEEANSVAALDPDHKPTPEERRNLLRRQDLMLSRRRVLQQLEASSNDRYSDLLRRTLVDLDGEIAALQ